MNTTDRRKQAYARIADILCIAGLSQLELLEAAAEGLAWRTRVLNIPQIQLLMLEDKQVRHAVKETLKPTARM